METTVLTNVRNCLRISICGGAAKNLSDLLFGEKPKIFGKIGRIGEWACRDLLSVCINAMASNASDAAISQK
jgi:hypothetical protein